MMQGEGQGKLGSMACMCLFLCLLICPAAAEEVLRIATYNLRNYLIEDRMVEGWWKEDYPKPESEKRAVWEVILEVNPDILILQEMGSTPFLEELRRDLSSKGLHYPHGHVVDAVDEQRHLAILSKYPYRRRHSLGDRDFPYFGDRIPVKRGLLEVDINLGETPFTLFGVHLKSRYTDNPQDPDSHRRRVGEARTIRNAIRERFPPETQPRYLVVGDFNDTRRSSALDHFYSVGDRILTEAIPAADSRGETWTYYYAADDVYSRVDYLLASPALHSCVVGGSGTIEDLEAAMAASDHRMVWIDLKISPPDADQHPVETGKN